ncbi:MAG: formylglycine-generating enzyme family protein [Deltaproteobacteria bacterium]|jgi:formylglycine-generating enzyme required for sulfatase activity|nr:formylglycine-generating enzyme family protein [Deltaproteobacteria bacterium]
MRIITGFFTALCLALASLGAWDVSLAAEKTHSNSLGMEFVLIPAGSFMMGTAPHATEGSRDERPARQVTISKPFYLGKYETTQAQWEAVMGNNPSKFKGPYKPVEQVSWHDAQEFIKRLNAREGHGRYRLPTEAEWEYAARAGTNGAWFFGDDANELSKYAWYGANAKNTTHPVGQKPANPWGLHDVYGNVWEWVQDWYGGSYSAKSPGHDPKGAAIGLYRVLRGGSWFRLAGSCRSGTRASEPPDHRGDSLGFRLALSPE